VDVLVLNAARPLFEDVRIRRAVAYALDRRILAGSYADLPTDGIVAPAVPGFGPAHVYPLSPDLATARRLAGHARRRAVLYYCTNGPFGGTGHAHVAALVRSELARIGISVAIVAPPCSPDSRYDAHSRHADLILASTFSPILDPEPFLSQRLPGDQLGNALGRGLWTDPQFLARVRHADTLTGRARRLEYRQLERQLLEAAPVAVFGSFYDGHYLSPHVGCHIVPPGANVVDLGMLCKRRTT
jgi:ABC-type transport system substrate-binding protein